MYTLTIVFEIILLNIVANWCNHSSAINKKSGWFYTGLRHYKQISCVIRLLSFELVIAYDRSRWKNMKFF